MTTMITGITGQDDILDTLARRIARGVEHHTNYRFRMLDYLAHFAIHNTVERWAMRRLCGKVHHRLWMAYMAEVMGEVDKIRSRNRVKAVARGQEHRS